MHWCADINALQRPLLHAFFCFLSGTGRACLLRLRLEFPRYQPTEGGGCEISIMYDFCSSLTYVQPLQNAASRVCTRWMCDEPSLFILSAHKEQRKPSHSNPLFELSVPNVVLQKQTGISSCQAEREDWAVGQVTSNPAPPTHTHTHWEILTLFSGSTQVCS